jgi:hypothetical protein
VEGYLIAFELSLMYSNRIGVTFLTERLRLQVIVRDFLLPDLACRDKSTFKDLSMLLRWLRCSNLAGCGSRCIEAEIHSFTQLS